MSLPLFYTSGLIRRDHASHLFVRHARSSRDLSQAQSLGVGVPNLGAKNCLRVLHGVRCESYAIFRRLGHAT